MERPESDRTILPHNRYAADTPLRRIAAFYKTLTDERRPTIMMRTENGKGAGGKEPVRTSALPATGEFMILSPSEIFVGNLNPRKTFDEEKLNELVASVKEKGVLEPLL